MSTPSRRFVSSPWTRREWLARNSAAIVAATHPALLSRSVEYGQKRIAPATAARIAAQATSLDPGPLEALAKQAVEAAQAAGARYADARLTQDVQHHYTFGTREHHFDGDFESIGVGVRVLVDGYWGFSASPVRDSAEVVRLARDAVAQARVNAKGRPRTVDLGQIPVVTGRWVTPVAIDPFTVTVEEKLDYMEYWQAYAQRIGLGIDPRISYLHFARQERVAATSDGSCITQTVIESGGVMAMEGNGLLVEGIEACGKGWELFLDAHIPEQFTTTIPAMVDALRAANSQGGAVGRYTLVCDGATMASLVEQTVGLATQLDRALGYEANGEGTSFLDDPLGMLGHFQMAAPMVTITANRSAPAQLATVKWDDEGVAPVECTLVKNGVLNDFQTTREQAAWLAPYYVKQGRAVRSQGCAAAENALAITMQHMPNLALKPNTAAVGLDDLISTVKDGILVVKGEVHTDHQARNGLITLGEEGSGAMMRRIRNGRLGPRLAGGTVQFNTLELWRDVLAIGGTATQATIGSPALNLQQNVLAKMFGHVGKGQPPQLTSHSTTGVAALIASKPLINTSTKG